MHARLVPIIALAALCACAPPESVADAGAARSPDDVASADGAVAGDGASDATGADVASADGQSPDAAPLDAALLDAALPDAALPDAAGADAATPDAAAADAAHSDVSSTADVPGDAAQGDGAAGGDTVPSDVSGGDASGPDASGPDASDSDTVPSDTSGSDTAPSDATASDASQPDATDAGPADAAASDAATVDSGPAGPPPTSCPDKALVPKLKWAPNKIAGAPVPAVHCAKSGWLSAPHGQALKLTDISASVGVDSEGPVDPCVLAEDFDGDGDVDVVLIGQPKVAAGSRTLLFYRNLKTQTGKLSFKLTATPLPWGSSVGQCIAADLDNDGDRDVLLAGGISLGVLRNDAGVLKPAGLQWPKITERTTPAVAVLDYDHDGDLDLIAAPYTKSKSPPGPNDICVCKPASDPPYTACSGGFCTSVDNDLLLLRNDGKLSFKHVATLPTVKGDTWSLTVHDLDRDGWADVFVGNEWGGHAWLRSKGGAVFDVAGTQLGFRPYAHVMGSAVLDYDRDGVLDLAVADYGADTLYRGAGDATYTNGSQAAALWSFGETAVAWSTVAADLNLDGWGDLIMSTTMVPTKQTLHGPVTFGGYQHTPGSGHLVRRNTGGKFQGTWLAWASGASPHISPAGWAVADLDGDGDLDVVGTSYPGKVAVHRNDTPQQGHWLGVRLSAKTSAPGGEGAWLYVWAGGHVQQRYVTHAPGLGAGGAHRTHIGLGSATQVDLVRVRWPSGKVSTVKPSQIDTWLTVAEP